MSGMDLAIEISETLSSDRCDDCDNAIFCKQTMTDPAAFDCRLNTPRDFVLYCPDIEDKIQRIAKETYREVLDDEGFAPIHLTYTKEVDQCLQLKK